MATIYDVARQAGVSAKTVSRFINADGPVSPATRKAVEQAIRDLGYVPSNAARMMRASKSGLVGLITGAITGAISTVNEATQPEGLPELFIVQGIQQVMAKSGMTVMIADTGGRQDSVPHLIDTFVSHRVDGLIYVAEYHQRVTLPAVPVNTPLVLANCFDDKGTPAILPDDERGQYDLVSRLIKSGHSRVAYLTLRDEIVATQLRSRGYRQALSEAGILYDPNLVRPCELNGHPAETQLIWDAIDRMLRMPEPPTVFCCGNDKMALKVYGILRSRGLRLPEDISVAGYDNYRVIAETLYPPLTTVDLPYFAMGARAGQRVLSLISGQGRDDRAPTLVSGTVFWRASVTEKRAANVTQLNTFREEQPK